MAYGLIRVRELGRGELSTTQLHNARGYDKRGLERPENIDFSRTGQNLNLYFEGNSIQESVDARLAEAKVKERTNSVVAIEFVVGASKDFWEAYQDKAFFDKCEQWLCDRYGEENVVCRSDHFDENNPHSHFIVTPIIEKEVKWKNRGGEGVKTENRLAARDLTGGKEKLRQLQDDYFAFVKKFDRYGVPFYRGTKVEDQKRVYVKHTSFEIGQLNEQITQTMAAMQALKEGIVNGLVTAIAAREKEQELLVESVKLEEKLTSKLEENSQKTNEFNGQINKHEQRMKNNGWKKGRDFEQGF